jgi:hypothetical protein
LILSYFVDSVELVYLILFVLVLEPLVLPFVFLIEPVDLLLFFAVSAKLFATSLGVVCKISKSILNP